MNEWWVWAVFLAAIVALDRVFLWLERRGWIYWRGGVVVKAVSVDLTPCPDCLYRVSPRALACPACGRLLRPWVLVLGALTVALLAVWIWRLADALGRSGGS
jgi:hypothetical protein